MNFHSRSKIMLIVVLSISSLASGCSAQWIKVALADLPVLLQVALNIGSAVTMLQSGNQLSANETAAIQEISNQATKDLNLLQTLYNEYNQSPNSTTIQKIQNVIADINQNLSVLLQASHINDAVLSARVTAAVNLIVSTVNSFAALIPQPAASITANKETRKAFAVPNATQLKKQWNEQVCGSTGKPEFDSAFSSCAVK